jgi:hypothetical protein
MCTPTQAYTPVTTCPLEQHSQIAEEISIMKAKGAIIPMSNSSPEGKQGFFSTMFVVPKKDGQMRPVVNLRDLNRVRTSHFKKEGVQSVS